MKKPAKAKTKKGPKKGAVKPAAASKAATKKSPGEKKPSAPARRDTSAPTMGWGWPAFRYPLQ
jgi:hypothetical protein